MSELTNEIEISFEDNVSLEIEQSEILKACEMILKEEGIEIPCEISVMFTSNDRIQSLNKAYRSKDAITDVLSFQQFDSIDEIMDFPVMPVYIGDIVISVDRAKTQSEEYGHSLKREIIYLVVHSMYHLLGFDHMDEQDKKVMRQKEKVILKKLEIFKGEVFGEEL